MEKDVIRQKKDNNCYYFNSKIVAFFCTKNSNFSIFSRPYGLSSVAIQKLWSTRNNVLRNIGAKISLKPNLFVQNCINRAQGLLFSQKGGTPGVGSAGLGFRDSAAFYIKHCNYVGLCVGLKFSVSLTN